jgi:hypothetical protein
MNWRNLFSSPPPATGWLLDGSLAAVIRRESRSRNTGAAQSLTPGLIEVGPVGLQSVNRERLTEVLAALNDEVSGARRPAVVIPSAWVRGHLMDFDHLPRRRAEVDDVVRWRLKKLLPVPPAQLRLSTVAQPTQGSGRRLLVMVGLERAFAELEGAFTAIGVQPGTITPRIFALANSLHGAAAAYRLIIQQEHGFLSMLLLASGAPFLVRSKPLPESEGPWQVVAREQHLAISFVREELAVEEELRVEISVEAAELDHGLRAWWSDQDGVVVVPQPAAASSLPGELGTKLGTARLEPVYAVIGGRGP